MAKTPSNKTAATLKHEEAPHKNIPTAEFQSVMQKDEQDWSELAVHATPLHIQEKAHPKVLIDDLLRETKEREQLRPDAKPRIRSACSIARERSSNTSQAL